MPTVSQVPHSASSSADSPLLKVVLWACLAFLLPQVSAARSDPLAGIDDSFSSLRHDMVESQLKRRGIKQPNLLSAMGQVPRHRFVPRTLEDQAYLDLPVTIAPGQTLSQAFVSARMIALLELDGDETVLEIGTGSGYDAAVLSRLAKRVFTIEIDRSLGDQARSKLTELGYDNVRVRVGDGYRGWPDQAPFDAILVTTAPERVPEPLFEQLAVGGRMVVAVGYSLYQDLKLITKTGPGKDDREVRRINLISLAPMTGEVTQDPDP